MRGPGWGMSGRGISFYWVCVFLVWLLPASVEGACGASASSCKNCHEIRGAMRVNTKGAYHAQHAFGDFCVFCHSGNTAGTTRVESHQGMVRPLENLQKSCAACHPDDYEKRAVLYGAVIQAGGGPSKSVSLPAAGTEKGSTTKKGGKAKETSSGNREYVIAPPTPDPSKVPRGDLIDYNLDRSGKARWRLPGTVGDRILLLLTLFLFLGFPFLSWFYRRSGPAREKGKTA